MSALATPDILYPLPAGNPEPEQERLTSCPSIGRDKYILVSESPDNESYVGHMVPVSRVADRWYLGCCGAVTNYRFKGLPINEPVEVGDMVMVLNPRYIDDRWATGTVSEVHAASGQDAAFVRITNVAATERGRRFAESEIVMSYMWVKVTGAPLEGVEEWRERTFPVSDVQSWYGYPVGLLPTYRAQRTDDGERLVLVTHAQRRASLIGKIQSIKANGSGAWYTTDLGDYVIGAPVNTPVSRGDRVRDLTATDQSDAVGTVVDVGRRVTYYRPDTEAGPGTGPERPTRVWTVVRPEPEDSRDFDPSPTDTPEVSALKERGRILQNRWDTAIGALTLEASQRSWTEHLAAIAQDVGFDTFTRVDYIAQVNVSCAVNLRTRATEEMVAAAKSDLRNSGDLPQIDRGFQAVVFSHQVDVLMEDVSNMDQAYSVPMDTLRERALAKINAAHGYNLNILDVSRSVRVGLRA